MKKRVAGIFLALTFGLEAGGDIVPTPPAPADHSGFYAGGALTIQRTFAGDSDWVDDSVLGQDKTGAITALAGYRFNRYFAVEGRIGQSVFAEDYADVLSYSLFLKPMYPVTEEFTVYALLGYGVVRVKGEDGDIPAANVGKTIVDKGSFQWGFGLGYDLSERWTLFLDYTKLMNKKSIDPQPLYDYDETDGRTWDRLSDDTLNLGVIYHF
jgi:opacity protein-like surface antigen